MPVPTPGALPVLALLAVLVGGCGGGTAGADDGPTRLLVSAAASLTDAFAEVEAAFEDVHPDVDVALNLAGSSTLREQIVHGAPADVFASADTATMTQVVDAGKVDGEPTVFATNGLVIAVPAGNPAGVVGLPDLADPGLYVGLCAEEVPCGRLAGRALSSAGVTPAVDTHEPDVRALLTKVAAGELDAGITYATDVAAAGDAVDGVAIPAVSDVRARYLVAVLAGAPEPATARRFVAFVLSEAGQRILHDHGFGAP